MCGYRKPLRFPFIAWLMKPFVDRAIAREITRIRVRSALGKMAEALRGEKLPPRWGPQ